jgi:hypothetical protein
MFTPPWTKSNLPKVRILCYFISSSSIQYTPFRSHHYHNILCVTLTNKKACGRRLLRKMVAIVVPWSMLQVFFFPQRSVGMMFLPLEIFNCMPVAKWGIMGAHIKRMIWWTSWCPTKLLIDVVIRIVPIATAWQLVIYLCIKSTYYLRIQEMGLWSSSWVTCFIKHWAIENDELWICTTICFLAHWMVSVGGACKSFALSFLHSFYYNYC